MQKFGLMILGCLVLYLLSASAMANLVCNTDDAYAAGVYAGQQRQDRQTDYGLNCAVNKEAINQAYLKGYDVGIAGARLPQRQCLKTELGKVCGFSCLRDQYGGVKCARYPTQQCLKDEFGNIICGYHCAKSSQGSVKCGKNYEDYCVADRYGDIKCGPNCRLTQMGIQCGDDQQ